MQSQRPTLSITGQYTFWPFILPGHLAGLKVIHGKHTVQALLVEVNQLAGLKC
jgi:hypothetical protein